MAAEDAVLQNIIVYRIGPVFAILGAMWYFRTSLKYHTQQRVFAWYMNRITKRMNRGLYKYKSDVFREVQNYKNELGRDLKVLDVGAGSAANLQFLPKNTELTCLDPNPHFVGYIKKNLKQHDSVVAAEIVTGYAEQMPLEDESFDVVIITLVLCSVKDIDKALAEVKRVLKKVFLH